MRRALRGGIARLLVHPGKYRQAGISGQHFCPGACRRRCSGKQCDRQSKMYPSSAMEFTPAHQCRQIVQHAMEAHSYLWNGKEPEPDEARASLETNAQARLYAWQAWRLNFQRGSFETNRAHPVVFALFCWRSGGRAGSGCCE